MPVEPVLVISPDRPSFDGRTERVVLKVRAFDEFEKPAGGLVTLSASVGSFIGGSDLILDHGFVTGTFACDPDEDQKCLGPIRINADWNGLSASVQVLGFLENPPAPVEWEVVPTNVTAKLNSLVAQRDVVWGVGDNGAAVQLVGRSWRVLFTGVNADLHAVTLTADGTPVAVGDDGVVLRWTPGGYERFSAGHHSLRALAFDDRGTLYVGTDDGFVLVETVEGFMPELKLSTPVRSLVNKDGEVWATGDGVLAKSSNGAWTSLPSPVAGRLDVAIAGKDSLWLLGQRDTVHATQGLLVSGPMPMWKTAALAEPMRGLVEVPLAKERFAFGDTQLFRQLDDGAWKSVDCPAAGMRAAASRGNYDLVLVGPPGVSLLRKP
ncbi:MAG: hypothetical protein JNM17_02030 [Archangium sp.]|nr:hypothetical protein [Archangium sp.]